MKKREESRDNFEPKRIDKEFEKDIEKLSLLWEAGVKILTAEIEERDPATDLHQKRVTTLACVIAREIGLNEDQVEGVRIASMLHDIGKIYIPDEILNKPSRLTESEFSIVKGHSQRAYEILKLIEFPWPVAQIVLQHHERMDGSGYPQNLEGNKILLEARVLAVADVVEAMASDRPYRPAFSIDKVLEEIEHNKGILYDSMIVDVVLRLFKDKGFKFE